MRSNRYVITDYFDTPCGEMILGATDDRLCLCDWVKSRHRRTIDNRIQKQLLSRYMQGTSPVIEQAKEQIAEFFDGTRSSFDLDLYLTGTDFQKKVWGFITQIPYGTTTSYSQLTTTVASETDIRAVSNAVGANALSLIIPCHRVIGSRGQLTGYAGGLVAKQYLINLEKTFMAVDIADTQAMATAMAQLSAECKPTED